MQNHRSPTDLEVARAIHYNETLREPNSDLDADADAFLASLEVECPRCAGSGITGHRIRTGSYVGPGPVPDDARGFVESRCNECRGSGRLEQEALR